MNKFSCFYKYYFLRPSGYEDDYIILSKFFFNKNKKLDVFYNIDVVKGIIS